MMRYSVYKELVGLSESVVEALEYVKSSPGAVSLIADCADAILMIKDTFNKNDIELKEIDSFLEVLEKLLQCIEKNENYSVYTDTLLDLGKKINEYCKNEVEYKFRILFLAELGAKWDSMDSVYRAFKERKDCEVEVVIAPVFRAVKYPNGETKSNIIYEDFLTPMGIEHIPFKDYDIKKDLPDITFSSQPYESVTTEQFWAENIAPYTHLVYLPYFTAINAITEEDIYVLCQMPMHQLAWKVVCQSEKQKAFYSKHMQNGGRNLIACGLPKWDWVVNMDKRDIEFPKGWEKLKGKKVMLINFHYNFGSDPGLNFFRRIEEFLEYSNDENIGCIFRFHPLTETMFKVYCTELQEDYENTLRRIEESANCVIDKEVLYDSAFKFSDFLFSSCSSLAYQYMLTEKPIVYRWADYNIDEENDNVFLRCSKLGAGTDWEKGKEIRRETVKGNDMLKAERMQLLKEDIVYNDGKVGERLASVLVEELIRENI